MLLLAFAACFPQLATTADDSALDSGVDSGDSAADSDTASTGCVQKGVDDAAEAWDLPTGFPTDTFASTADLDYATAPSWGLLDLDGNGRRDVVMTRDDASGVSGLGTTVWSTYSNTGSKFRVSAESWTLPGGFADLTFQTPADLDLAATPTWGLADLTGDGLTDLVVTRDDNSGVDGLSGSLWLLYRNTGSGFSGSPTSWSLPAGYDRLTFSSVYDDSSADPAWTLTDLDADGKLDFVITHDDNAGVSGLGSSTWMVFLNSGSGFATTGTPWDLPPGYSDGTFATAYDASSADPAWGLADLDGNGRTDVVVTQDASAGAVGNKKWLYYSNTGAKFRSESTEWALPVGLPDGTFTTLADASTDSPNWSLADLDRDGKLDIVVTRNDAAGIPELGTSRWQLFTNEGAGFAADNTAWPLPAGFPELSFPTLYDSADADLGWTLTDIDGDNYLDLLVTHNANGSSALGTTTWDRYLAHCK